MLLTHHERDSVKNIKTNQGITPASKHWSSHRVSSMIAGTICCSPILDLGTIGFLLLVLLQQADVVLADGTFRVTQATVFVACRNPRVQHASALLLGHVHNIVANGGKFGSYVGVKNWSSTSKLA